MTVRSIYKLLDKLEMNILKGVPVPLTPTVILNQEKLIELLDQIRSAIPTEIQEAYTIIQKREDIQSESQRHANKIMTDAREQAEQILSESELLRAVRAEAEKLRDQVISECEDIKRRAISESAEMRSKTIAESGYVRESADRYAESILSALEKEIMEMHNSIKTGQKQLEEMKIRNRAELAKKEVTKNIYQQAPVEELKPHL